MFQLFLRARAHNYLRTRLGDRDFRARSPERDAETDRSRVSSIIEAVEHALHAAEQEQSGLSQRVEDVLARAAVIVDVSDRGDPDHFISSASVGSLKSITRS